MRIVGRLLSFSTIPLIGAVAPLLVLPVIARIGGAEGWSAIAVGQAVGSAVATIVGLGYGVAGPSRVARLAVDAAKTELKRSFSAKILVLTATVPVIILVSCALVPPSAWVDAALMALASASVGVSFSWFSIGRGDALQIVRWELLPRLSASVLALGLVLLTRQLWVYPLLLLTGTFIGTAGLCRELQIGPLVSFLRPRLRSLADAKVPWRALMIDGTSAAYVALPLVIAAALLTTNDTAQVASADKLYRYGLFVIVAAGNGVQGWILERGRTRWEHSLVIVGMVSVGIVGFVVLGVLGPTLTGWLFGEHVAATGAIALGYGVAYLAVAASTPLVRNILVPVGRTELVLIGTIVSAVVGLGTMITLSVLLGAVGISTGFALSETAMLIVAVIAVMGRVVGRAEANR